MDAKASKKKAVATMFFLFVFFSVVVAVEKCSDATKALFQDAKPLEGFHLVMQWVLGDASQRLRQMDYNDALRLSLANQQIDSIHLLVENEHAAEVAHQFVDFATVLAPNLGVEASKRLYICNLHARATYANLTLYAQKRLSGMPVILTNADIGVGSGLERANTKLMLENRIFYAPTRYSVGGVDASGCDCRSNYNPGCADTFIFVASAEPLSKIVDALHIPFGDIAGGENVFMYEFSRVGFTISNPCKSIVMWHFHRHRVDSAFRENYGRVNNNGRSAVAGGALEL